nr:hypothetical protein [Actinomycetota bacterium]
MKKLTRSPFTYVLLGLVAVIVVIDLLRGSPSRTTLGLAAYQSDLAVPGKVVSAVIHDGSSNVTGKLADGTSYIVQYPDRYAADLTGKVLAAVPGSKTVHS